MQKRSPGNSKLNLAFLSTLLFYLVPAQICWSAPVDKVKRLQHAIHLIDTDPKSAERELLLLKDPQAKAYLAYLYFTRKVPTSNPSVRVDALMNQIKVEVPNPAGEGNLDPNKRLHYKDLDTLLWHLRFITDASDSQIAVPQSIMKEHPAEFLDNFRAYWGSSRDGYLSVDQNKAFDINNLPLVRKYIANLNNICGSPQGTISSMYHRKQYLAELTASLAPQWYLTEDGAQEVDPNLAAFLRRWSNDELWNKQKYQYWLSARKGAEASLATYYEQKFQLASGKARTCANRALNAVSKAYLSEYSPSGFKDEKLSDIYKLFDQKQLSLTDVQKQLPDQTSQEDLAQALRMSILNGHSLEIIEFLIKKGAPTCGGTEPPLFSAVLRPDVVQLLLKSGAKATEENNLGKTALIQAAQYDNLESCKLLKAAGADVNHKMIPAQGEAADKANFVGGCEYTIGNRTALMYAAQFASFPVIKYLLECGADPRAVDSTDVTAGQMLKDNDKLTKAEKILLQKQLK